jgi:predicted dinucleotide-binding enzyme
MRIAILGSGNVGGTLGRKWANVGHEVAFGVRDVMKGAAAVKGGDALPPGARVTSVRDAVQGAEVLVLATPWAAVAAALREAAVPDGMIVIDATNPIAPGFTLDEGANSASGAERIQAMVPTARVVKAFNTTGFANMAEPVYDGAKSVMFYAGNDVPAKQVVHTLVDAIGFEAIDAGALVRSRELEHLALLWIGLAFGGMGRDFAFRLVRR